MIATKAGTGSVRRGIVALLAAFAAVATSSAVAADKAQKPQAKTFASPEEAAKAVIAAAKAGDSKGLSVIFGPGSDKVLQSGDKVADKEARERFVKAAEEANALEKSGDAKAILTVGKDKWPFPVPIVKAESGWQFDVNAGKEEILNRRIGRNELFTVQSILAYVDAQRDYYVSNPENAKLLQYAQKMASSPGKRDGLAWQTAGGKWEGPVGEEIARAIAEGYNDKREPYHGYYFKILKGQGPAAPMGQMDFVVDSAMIGGFALVAAPADYLVTGVNTFIVSYEGIIYEKDLGDRTLDEFRKMERYNPDSTWKAVPDS